MKQKGVMHKAPETGVDRKHNNDIKNRIEMSSKTYADIAVANEKITNEEEAREYSKSKQVTVEKAPSNVDTVLSRFLAKWLRGKSWFYLSRLVQIPVS
ncbi:hypothetical protein EVAR_102536_1 [Eumeta japonica]|uniref:Uncharacterized protein n=1 Tax=Eumeta variegata TaxID=151549 RepID=A0A4C1TQE8_EUMVA|nr:hypothetical protein EVAR_102536_1 [Eumeta japonica]